MRKTVGFSFFVVLLATIFAFQNCGRSTSGTETGNLGPGAGTGSPDINMTYSGQILVAVCNKVNECYPSASVSACETQLIQSTAVDTLLGLPAGYGTFQAIITAENGHQLTPNVSAFDSCQMAITQQSCNSGEATTAYSTANPSNYADTYMLIPNGSACQQLF